MRRLLSVLVLVAALAAAPTAHAWIWPAEGVVLRPFSLGPNAYAAGQHRGIDVSATAGPVRAPAGGTVTFAGSVPTRTTESAGSFVLQVTVAVDVPIADTERAEIVGGVTSAP